MFGESGDAPVEPYVGYRLRHRIALMFATATMPIIEHGRKTGSSPYASAGLTLTLGIAD